MTFSYFCSLTKKYPMIKKLAILATVTCFILASAAVLAQDNSVTSVKPEEFPGKAESLLGQKVQIEGLVVHVCKHGGKKMFIIGENPDIRIRINASDQVTVFSTELEGNTVLVKGIVEPMSVEEMPESEKQNEDQDHTNYYHQKQYSISCSEVKVID